MAAIRLGKIFRWKIRRVEFEEETSGKKLEQTELTDTEIRREELREGISDK